MRSRGLGHKIVPILIGLGLLLAAFIYRDALIGWFTGPADGTEDADPAEGSGHAAHAGPDGASDSHAHAGEHPLADPALEQIEQAFGAYEVIRSALSHDTLEGVAAAADTLVAALEAAHEHLHEAPAELGDMMMEARAAAQMIGGTADIETARAHFAGLSRGLIGLAQADPRLQEGWHVFLCPMGTGYRRWFQRPEQLENPFFGAGMISCGQPSEWDAGHGAMAAAEGSGEGSGTEAMQEHAHGAESDASEPAGHEIAYYTCSMHPSVRAQEPGNCPICGMQLTPVTYEELRTGAVRVDAVRRQRIGVRTGVVERSQFARQIRAVGRVTYDESRLHDVTLRVDGWIQRLRVDTTGQEVERGQQLFDVWSPDLYAAQLELLVANRSGPTDGPLAEASRQRLELLGMSESQIEALEERGEVRELLSIRSPAGGFVIEKDVVEGDFVMAGERIYRIADLDTVWVEAEVYEPDLPLVAVGQTAEVTFPTMPGRFEGQVTYVYPYLQAETRTGRIRIELSNPGHTLRADMYADVHISVDLGERLVVPVSAVIYTGPRRLVFVMVDAEEGLMVPRAIEVGQRSGGDFEVRSGLAEGEVVVTSGNYLIAAESRLRGAAEYWGAGAGGSGHAGH